VAVKIKLKRLGKIRAPYYRIVVADARTKRDGRAIEEIGKYHPKAEPSFIEVNSERAQHWLSVGAQPTDPVRKLLEITGDWQKFKGLPGTEGTLRTAAPKQDRKEIFAAAVSETLTDGAAAPKGRAKAKAGDAAKDGDGAAGKGSKAASDRGAAAKAEKPARSKAAATPEAAGPATDTQADAAKPEAEAPEAEAPEAEAPEAEAPEAEAEPDAEAPEAEAEPEAEARAEAGANADAATEPESGA
jgi:small subunit ribosomal protein S16